MDESAHAEQLLKDETALDFKGKCEDLEEFCHDLLDLANQLEPGMLVSSEWTEARNRLIKQFMEIAGLMPRREDL